MMSARGEDIKGRQLPAEGVQPAALGGDELPDFRRKFELTCVRGKKRPATVNRKTLVRLRNENINLYIPIL